MTSTLIISISIPILILIANIIYTSSRDRKKNYDKRIDEKLNKDEYLKDQMTVDHRIQKCEDVTQILMDIKLEQAATRTDITWIRESFSQLECRKKK